MLSDNVVVDMNAEGEKGTTSEWGGRRNTLVLRSMFRLSSMVDASTRADSHSASRSY